jgi:hypothetical protein
MSFGQSSGPSASPKQVQYLLALLQKAGHDSFRDARGPMGLTQRQSSGKFTRDEASAMIDQLESGALDANGHPLEADESAASKPVMTGAMLAATTRLDAQRRDLLKGMPAEMLAGELEQRGWCVIAPTL